MLSTIVTILVVLVAIILLLAWSKPNTFRVERSATINASPETIFPMLNDFRRWTEWSPWEKLDPDLKRTFGGPATGVGSWYAWEGNKKAGKGRMEIKESEPTSRLLLDLDFIKPFEAHNKTEFNLTPNGNGTDFNWALYGPAPLMTKVMMVFTTMDKLVGKDFDRGIVNLKTAVDGTPRA